VSPLYSRNFGCSLNEGLYEKSILPYRDLSSFSQEASINGTALSGKASHVVIQPFSMIRSAALIHISCRSFVTCSIQSISAIENS
jgi:hypothetical protein